MIRSATPDDAQALCAIYNHYVLNTLITFEEQAVTHDAMGERIAQISASCPWLVMQEQGTLIGFAYASPWKNRSAYRFCLESTLYLAQEATGRGAGRQLYEALLAALRAKAIHSVIAGIALPNPASVALHQKMGFEQVAHFKQLGWKFEQWIDVAYWELTLS